MKKLQVPMTDAGRKYFDAIMVTLGKKTKKQFEEAVWQEFQVTSSKDHQMLNLGDIGRVADHLNVSIVNLLIKNATETPID